MIWRELTKLTGGAPFLVERVRLPESGVAIEGAFEPPPLSQLPEDDQVFVMAFIQSHGSIKRMEELFDISYPTVKNRLNAIAARLPLVDLGVAAQEPARPEDSTSAVLDQLERGELSAAEAADRIRRTGHRAD